MTWIKICGITNLEDALTAVEAGADALGFVFYEKSPRNVAPDTVLSIFERIPDKVERVGVFVNAYADNILELVHGGLTASQIHFRVDLTSGTQQARGAVCFPANFRSYLSMPADWFIENEVQAKDFIAQLTPATRLAMGITKPPPYRAIFLDSGTLQQPGGTGIVFDWKKATGIVDHIQQTVPIVVAGGLSPINVSDAIRILRPWGVDVSSGVEARPGKKNPAKVRAFVEAVRRAGKN